MSHWQCSADLRNHAAHPYDEKREGEKDQGEPEGERASEGNLKGLGGKEGGKKEGPGRREEGKDGNRERGGKEKGAPDI